MSLPLNKWRDGMTRRAILDFVARVTEPGGPDFVPDADRIAVFDNDGTLWSEQPMPVQAFFLAARLRELAARDASLKERQPFKAFLEGDHATLQALGKPAIIELLFATHAGMTEDEFEQIARSWFGTARHPRFGRLCREVTFAPQVELLHYLRSHGFATFIVSGGGVDFIRAFAAEAYGIPPQQVIGSSGRLRFNPRTGHVDKLGEVGSFDDREEKVANIALHIGKRPILCAGNSDGDLAMLQYTLAGRGPRLGLLVHHDDEVREAAYDRDFALSPLREALERADELGITLVSVKDDWNSIFAPVGAAKAA